MKVVNTENNSENIECAIDSTGFKITIRGDYLGNKDNVINLGALSFLQYGYPSKVCTLLPYNINVIPKSRSN